MITFDQTKKMESSFVGEAVRLYNEIKGGVNYGKTIDGESVISPVGYDPLTISLAELKTKVGKSEAQDKFIQTLIKIREGTITKDELVELGKCGMR